MKTQHRSLIKAAGLAAALSLTGCASITAPDMDYAAPAPSVTLTATGVSRLFSRFTGSVGVAATSLTRAGAPGAAPAVAYIGVTGATSTYRFDAAPPYADGDALSITWSGNTIDLFGRHSTTRLTATYRFVNGVLRVETPRYGLGPGKSGRVCVALLPNAAADTTVTLASSMFPVTPTTLTIPAGRSKATASATTTADGFSCPTTSTGSSAGTAGPVPSTPCTAQNGVTATASYGGTTLTGCGGLSRSCCGISYSCVAPGSSVPSICP
jgi:hypothetical protein